MGAKGFLVGQVPATHLEQRFLAGKGISLPQAPHLAQAKVPGRSLLALKRLPPQAVSSTSCSSRPSAGGRAPRQRVHVLLPAAPERPAARPAHPDWFFKYADAHGFTPIYSEAPFSVAALGVRPSLQPYFVQTGLEFSA